MSRNVVIFLCDQLRADFLSLYGCEAIPTPNLQRLADHGVVFDRAITQSTVCAPARATMMTGRFVSDHGVWTNDIPFRPGIETIAQRMNELGYATGALGKMHHTPADDAKGFQYSRFMEENRLKERDDYYQWLKKHHPEIHHIYNHDKNKLQFNFKEEFYYEYWIANEAINYLEGHRLKNPEKPFFAWVSFQGPHGPFDPPAEVKGSCNEELIPRPIKHSINELQDIPKYRSVRGSYDICPDEVYQKHRVAYGEMIVEIDKQIGRIIDYLQAADLYEQTTIIFSADHGDLLGDHALDKKGPFAYQGQLGIPMILSNHPQIEKGVRSQQLVGNIDIPGTVLAIAGATRSIGVSRSLLDLAQKEPLFPREVNYSEFCDSVKIIENGRYRYCYYPFTQQAELYDRESDPQELTNLAGVSEYVEIEKTFTQHIIDFLILSKGLRIEAHDFVPIQQEGVRKKHPRFEEDFDVVFPINRKAYQNLKRAGLQADYNEFCVNKPVLNSYSPPYWQ